MINKLYSGYQYVFYKFYTWDVWLHSHNDPFPQNVALFTISLLVWINFLSLLILLELITGYGFDQLKYLSEWAIIGLDFFYNH